ncbi:MAG: NAD(P)-dependent oxidoreductase, partial [Nocardioides sp.]
VALSGLEELLDAPDRVSSVGVVLLMLPDSRVVELVLEGSGLLAALTPGSLVIDMSSSVPASTRRLAAVAADLGVGYVDAPVSGGVSRAETGELAIMVGGEAPWVAAARPHLAPLGATIVHVGPPGAGHAAKALNNLLSATHLAAAAEVLSVAQRAGIEPEVMLEVLNSSTGRSQATEVKYPRHVLTGSFASGFELDLMVKDLGIAAGLTAEVGAAAPVTAAAVAAARAARDHLDRVGADHTELVRYVEHVNATSLRSPTDPTASGSNHPAGEDPTR